jgi:hypothetical protein
MEKLATVTTTFPISALSLLSIPEALDPEIPTIKTAHSATYPMVPMIRGNGMLMVGFWFCKGRKKSEWLAALIVERPVYAYIQRRIF